MRFVLLTFFLALQVVGTSQVVAAPISEGRQAILSFKQWKAKRIAEAHSILSQILREESRSRARSSRLKKRVAQARLNLQFARDLSAHDYFVVYLGEQFPGNRRALAFAARTMTPSELSEILEQYQGALLKPHEKAVPTLAPSISGMATLEHIGESRSGSRND